MTIPVKKARKALICDPLKGDEPVPFILIGIAVIVLFIILIVCSDYDNAGSRPHNPSGNNRPSLWKQLFTPEYKLVGDYGERYAAQEIRSVLREDDRLFSNVTIEYDGKLAELDNVIVNKYGVFIIEVKNYSGEIIGCEDDFEWQKYKTTDAGITYEKTVKNPIRQVKRQIYILARYLECNGARVWVKGYAILLQGNSPVDSNQLLNSRDEIDLAIHSRDRTMLSVAEIERISKLLD